MDEAIQKLNQQLAVLQQKAYGEYIQKLTKFPFLDYTHYLYDSPYKKEMIKLAKEIERMLENHSTIHFYVCERYDVYESYQKSFSHPSEWVIDEERKDLITEEDPLFVLSTPEYTQLFAVHELDVQMIEEALKKEK